MAKSAAAKAAAKAAVKAKHEAEVANIILHFDETYISNPSRLAAFQQLCRDLEVEVGTSLTQCKKVFAAFHWFLSRISVLTSPPQNVNKANVNIHDFVRVQQAGGNLNGIRYPSKASLRRNMQENRGRRFPLKKAKENEFLKAMLIEL